MIGTCSNSMGAFQWPHMPLNNCPSLTSAFLVSMWWCLTPLINFWWPLDFAEHDRSTRQPQGVPKDRGSHICRHPPCAMPHSGLIMKHLPSRSTQGSRKPVWKQTPAVMGREVPGAVNQKLWGHRGRRASPQRNFAPRLEVEQMMRQHWWEPAWGHTHSHTLFSSFNM